MFTMGPRQICDDRNGGGELLVIFVFIFLQDVL